MSHATIPGRAILPSDIDRLDPMSDASCEGLVLASSNALRRLLKVAHAALPPLPAATLVTRVNASLDNFCAELLLRSSHAPSNAPPALLECKVDGTTRLPLLPVHSELDHTILIGIGGLAERSRAVRIYDEHVADGRRREGSVTRLVFAEHVEPNAAPLTVAAIGRVVDEINRIDGQGGASPDHLYPILKVLHVAAFPLADGSLGQLLIAWKRAIVDAILVAAFARAAGPNADDEDGALLVVELDRYLAAREARGGTAARPTAVAYVKRSLVDREATGSDVPPNLLIGKRIAPALRAMWHPEVASAILGYLFESLLQAQESFEQIIEKPWRVSWVPGGYALVVHEKAADEIIPHRAILGRMRRERVRGILIMTDSTTGSTMAMRSGTFDDAHWKRFVALLRQSDGIDVWYVPTQANGEIASFALNRTEWIVGGPKTHLVPGDFTRLLLRAVSA